MNKEVIGIYTIVAKKNRLSFTTILLPFKPDLKTL